MILNADEFISTQSSPVIAYAVQTLPSQQIDDRSLTVYCQNHGDHHLRSQTQPFEVSPQTSLESEIATTPTTAIPIPNFVHGELIPSNRFTTSGAFFVVFLLATIGFGLAVGGVTVMLTDEWIEVLVDDDGEHFSYISENMMYYPRGCLIQYAEILGTVETEVCRISTMPLPTPCHSENVHYHCADKWKWKFYGPYYIVGTFRNNTIYQERDYVVERKVSNETCDTNFGFNPHEIGDFSDCWFPEVPLGNEGDESNPTGNNGFDYYHEYYNCNNGSCGKIIDPAEEVENFKGSDSPSREPMYDAYLVDEDEKKLRGATMIGLGVVCLLVAGGVTIKSVW